MSKDKKRLVPVRRFKEFENSAAWEQRKLGEVADIVGGGTPSTKVKEYWNGNINWYSPIEIGTSIYASESVKKITQLGLEKSSAKLLPKGTVLFTSRAGIGNTAILMKEATTNQGFQSIVPKKGVLNSYFIFTETPFLKRYGEINGAGSTFVEVSGKQMSKMPLLLPSFDEQLKIGNFFKQLDHLITLHQRKLDKLKRVKSAYLTELFPAEGEREPKRRFPGFTGAWEQRRLGEVADVRDGTHDSPKYINEGYPLLTSKNVGDGYINYDDVKYVSENDYVQINKRSKVDVNDILMGMIGTIGNLALIREEPDFAIKNVALIKHTSNFDYQFLFQELQTSAISKELLSGMDGGTQKFVSLKKIRNLSVMLPSENEQKKIGSYLMRFDSLIALHQRKLDKLKKMKAAYLNEMFV